MIRAHELQPIVKKAVDGGGGGGGGGATGTGGGGATGAGGGGGATGSGSGSDKASSDNGEATDAAEAPPKPKPTPTAVEFKGPDNVGVCPFILCLHNIVYSPVHAYSICTQCILYEITSRKINETLNSVLQLSSPLIRLLFMYMSVWYM